MIPERDRTFILGCIVGIGIGLLLWGALGLYLFLLKVA